MALFRCHFHDAEKEIVELDGLVIAQAGACFSHGTGHLRMGWCVGSIVCSGSARKLKTMQTL